jgi:uncharacterized membrane protein
MAGIGFDLIRLANKGNYRGLLGAYGLTTLISSGPSIFTIIGIGVVCFFNLFLTPDDRVAYQFLSIVIYLFSSSMILSSFFQYSFFRFIADRIYVNEFNEVTPNFIGVLLIQVIISCCFSLPVVFYFFSSHNLNLKILLIANFIILNMIWISTVLLTGIKSYRKILWAFFLSYITMIIVHFLVPNNNLNCLLFEFLLAQVILIILLLHAILDYYPTNRLIKFNFLKKDNLFYSLMFANFFFTLGFWVDKFIFWFNSDTSYPIFQPLRASPLYDFPMFIAYIAIIPAMAIFLFQIEAKFSMIYPKFMKTIFNRKTLSEIVAIRNELTLSGRGAILSLFKTQYTIVIALFLSISCIFTTLEIIPVYLNLLFILSIATSLYVILWGIVNILYYMTRYIQALYVGIIFASSNTLFTLISLYAGPSYFGYGFCFSLLLSICCALIFLNNSFNDLEYYTFMMTD